MAYFWEENSRLELKTVRDFFVATDRHEFVVGNRLAYLHRQRMADVQIVHACDLTGRIYDPYRGDVVVVGKRRDHKTTI